MIILILVLVGCVTAGITLAKGYKGKDVVKGFFKGMLIYGLIKAIKLPKKELELTDYISFSCAKEKDKAKIAEHEELGYEVVSMNALMTRVTMRKVK
ncbi:hypothetical protein EA794_07420 [Lactococcus petauri]|uniref:hypothetical protein n=1 Tax=Lactococcus petauri TaxID=1940789 RepID=UPI0013FD9FF4|nr:hypothetical protein [Lactococcus petauri]NHI75801.1 hypothetical protein [Lactococcus petauri]